MAGTGLAAISANTINQCMEIRTDALMKRTRGRPLPSSRISPSHALWFAGVTGVSSVVLLATFVNPLAALLAASSHVLYTCSYTPMKLRSVANTWVGAVVGAIPPLIGWAGATGNISSPEGWILAGILFSWQMPHFMSLAWLARKDYLAGGYKMLPGSNEIKAALVSIRHSIYLFPLSFAAPLLGMTTTSFAAEALFLNSAFLYMSVRFFQSREVPTALSLFKTSLLYLPLLLGLMVFHRIFHTEENVKEVDEDFLHTRLRAIPVHGREDPYLGSRWSPPVVAPFPFLPAPIFLISDSFDSGSRQ
eukprot:CAMPEP_0184656764 /NCGR_PEP_ID=MMETSP0308-20130426/16733_1 /TAXON_ID=38269 /ORGANISM="Gloeochaete witrockiana, Strain SAG 46.84" /LENGTH=304 /DNA_ID=CAMNT_0027094025 /DNA_START=380 /DNA_END=1294 /DNA_ORIENTATION=-